MSITEFPLPWAAPAPLPASAALRFGREVWVPAGASGTRPALQWVMRRNCSITPRQMMGAYGSLSAFSLLIAIGFWFQGAPFVLGFAGIELACLGVALLVYARHAGDRESILLDGRRVEVLTTCASDTVRADFDAHRVAVEPSAGQGSLIELSAQGRSVLVGRFLRPELRSAFAEEVRRALRRARWSADAGVPTPLAPTSR
jgi:uncharacterized membrane protein